MAEPLKPIMKDTPIAQLDLEGLGAALIMLLPTCLNLGHSSIQATLWYVHGEQGGAAAFIKDLLTLPPDEVAGKWYGGERLAKEMFARTMGRVLFGDDDLAADPVA